MGGGFIIIPAMISFMGMERHKAHATSLTVIVFVSIAAASFYSLHGNSDLRLALLLLAGSPVGVVIGAKIMHRIPARILGIIFGVFLVLIALTSIMPVTYQSAPFVSYPMIILLGALTGFLAGILGVGGGIIIIPLLAYLAGVSQQVAQGVSLVFIIPTALIGSFTHWRHGLIDFAVVPWIAASSLIFCLVGAYLANTLASGTLKSIFSIFILLIGLQTAISSYWKKPGKEKAG